MGENVVSSFNLFIDTDRGSPGSNSTGDDYQLNLNSVNLDADKGQIIRMTVNNFSMYKCFTNVNAHNSRFTLRTDLGYASLDLPHKNHDTIHKLALDFGDTLKDGLLVASKSKLSAADTAVISTITPANNVGVAGTSNNVISFKVEFLDTNGDPVAHDLTSALVQFYETDLKYDTDSDIYSLLGGNRIHDNADTTTNSITTTIDTNSITFTGLYPAQRHTEQYVYVGMRALSDEIAIGPLGALAFLSLAHNQIGDAGMTEFSRSITSGSLANCELINVEQNRITDQGIQSFAAALDDGAVRKLRTLHVYMNQATEAGIEVIMKAMTARGIKGSVKDAWDMGQ